MKRSISNLKRHVVFILTGLITSFIGVSIYMLLKRDFDDYSIGFATGAIIGLPVLVYLILQTPKNYRDTN